MAKPAQQAYRKMILDQVAKVTGMSSEEAEEKIGALWDAAQSKETEGKQTLIPEEVAEHVQTVLKSSEHLPPEQQEFIKSTCC